MNAVMSKQDLPGLIAAQRRLLMEKNLILNMLKQVRNEMQKLQVKAIFMNMTMGIPSSDVFVCDT